MELSIIVPVYNTEKYLKECIESILNQTFKDFELILVDDGSTDNSGYLCDEFARTDSRIKVIHQCNHGLSVARNIGLENSTGDWIAFVDSDDTIDQNLYYKLIHTAHNNKTDMAICLCNYTNENGNIISNIHIPNGKKYGDINVITSHDMITDILFIGEYGNHLFVAPWNKIFKKSILGKDPFEIGRIYEDDLLANTLYLNNYKIAIINEYLYNYRTNPTSISHTQFSKKNIFYLEILKQRVNIFEKYGFNNSAIFVCKLFTEIYIEYYFKAIKFGIQDEVLKYKKDFNKFFHLGIRQEKSKKNKIKFVIRVNIFKLSPNLYKLINQLKN